MRLSFVFLSTTLTLATVAACSDDKDDDPTEAGGAGTPNDGGGAAGETASGNADNVDGAADGGAASTQIEPLYVVSTGVISSDDFLGYLVPLHSLRADQTVNLDQAVELDNASFVFNRPGDESIYVASLSDPTIVRWEVSRKGELTERETLSFGNLGLLSAAGAAFTPIFSATKSYFTDEDQDEIVIWNPDKMELIDTIPLEDEDVGNLRPAPEGAILARGDQLIVTIGWRDPDNTTILGDHVRVVTIDTKTDQIVDSKLEDRNVHTALNAVTSDGTAYFSNYSLYAAYTEIGAGHGAPSTALRILPGGTSFDPGYALDLSKLVGGRPAGDLIFLDDDNAILRAWHPEIVDPVDPDDWKAVLWNQAGFKWWRWHVGDKQAVEIENQEPGTQGAPLFKIDGKTYTIRYAADLSSTDLIEIDPKGVFTTRMTTPGATMGDGVLRVH